MTEGSFNDFETTDTMKKINAGLMNYHLYHYLLAKDFEHIVSRYF